MVRTTTIRLDENLEKKLKEIAEVRSLERMMDVLRFCIAETHDRTCNNYRMVLKERTKRPKLTDEEKIQKRLEKEQAQSKAKADFVVERGRNICKQLGGVEILNANGSYNCSYQLFEKVGKAVLTGARSVPFADLSEEHVSAQYVGGTKEEIKKMLRDQ